MARFAASALVFCLAAVCAPHGARADQSGAWSEIFNIDCSGNINFMNNHLLAAQGNVNDVIDTAQFVAGREPRRRRPSRCPTVSV